MSFFQELKRRNVIRVALAYGIGSWVLLQIGDTLGPALRLPDWFQSGIAFVLILAFPVALIVAWVYEMTPEGIKREKDIDRSQSITPVTGKKLNIVITILLVLAIGGMVADRLIPEEAPPVVVEELTQASDESVDQASIAVLPFADLSEEGNQQFFTDGLSEELLNLLVRIDGLQVASRTSSFAYRSSTQSIPDIAASLGVAHVLEGSVRKSGDRIRITAQLIEAGTDKHLWSENFDRDLDDIFAIQDEIGTAIVNALKDELGIFEEVTVSVAPVTSNLSAYELYLEARELFIRRADLAESIRLYQEAIALDPEFAKAWEGLAAAEIVSDGWLFNDGIDHSPRAMQAARKALELDPDLSTAYAVIGDYARDREADKIEAMRNYDIALRLDPKNTTALLWRGLAQIGLGHLDGALHDLEKCVKIDPGYLNCSHFLATALIITGDESRAIEIFEQTLEHNFHSMTTTFIPYYVKTGQRSLALALADIALDLSNAPVIDWIRALESPEADHGAGLARWREWERTTESGLDFVEFPEILMAFGEFEQASRSVWVEHQLWHPAAARFRSSPYFKKAIVDRGIFSYWQESGFPEFCRPLGDDDFECDDPT